MHGKEASVVVVTGHDVARLAGVSQPTVSRALRGLPNVTAQTRRRVEEASRSLGYVPGDRGGARPVRASRRIGVVAEELTNPFYAELLEPLREALDERGLGFVLFADRRGLVAELVDGSLDGVLIATALLDSGLPGRVRARGLPVVLLNRVTRDRRVGACVVDNHRGGALVAEHLVGLGHRRVAAVAGPKVASTARDRVAGFRAGLGARGVDLPAVAVRNGAYTHGFGYEAMSAILREPSPPTAVFCGNDVIALGACSALTDAGRRAGRDMTVVGFDDIALGSWPEFSLTTVRYDRRALARGAVELLGEQLDDRPPPAGRTVLTPELVVRSTSGPPR